MKEEWIQTGNTSSLSRFMLSGQNQTLLAPLRAAIADGRLERLNVTECIRAYVAPFQSTRSDLVLVANGTQTDFGLKKPRDTVGLQMDRDDRCGTTQAHQWMCARRHAEPGGVGGS